MEYALCLPTANWSCFFSWHLYAALHLQPSIIIYILAGILVFQRINGFTFPALWVAGVSYANENAPAGLSAIAQAVFGTMIFGFGAAADGFLGGLLLESLGGQMYAIFGMMVLAMLAVYVFVEPRKPFDVLVVWSATLRIPILRRSWKIR